MVQKSQFEDHHEEILRLKSEGLRGDQIAARLQKSYPALISYCQRHGIRFPKTMARSFDQREMKRLADEGMTHAQIAERLGVSESAIERGCKRTDLRTGRTGPLSGAGHPDWNGGRRLEKHGYVNIWVPMHPRARSGTGSVAEHILVMEVFLGRFLGEKEVVHHRDDHPRHNWPSNLRHYASNADHLRDELTGRLKSSPRSSIPGAYLSTEKLLLCPSEQETLAQCPEETMVRLAWYIESFRPTIEHRSLSRRELLRQGARRDPFQVGSTDKCSDFPR